MKILVLDNYDSFTFNLVHLVEKVCGTRPDVFQNNKINLSEISRYEKIILSPGPGLPSESGILCETIRAYAQEKSILGVCLGHQAIVEVFGGKLRNLKEVCHGQATEISVTKKNEKLFSHLPANFLVGRYHSWVADEKHLPSCLTVTAKTKDDLIMAIRHKEHDVCGVQFHPESILSQYGEEIIQNWINS